MARAVKQRDLEVMKADLEVADLGINAHSENPNVLAMSAYHYGQAIEKALKAIIRIERPDIYKAVDRDGKPIVTTTHKIASLLNKAEICRHGTTAAHRFISENADTLSDFNNLRYGKMKISEAELRQLSQAAHEIVSELEKDFIKANPDIELNKQNAQHEWQSRKESGLINPPPAALQKNKPAAEKKADKQQISNEKKSKKPYFKNNNGSYAKKHGNKKHKNRMEREND